MDEGAEEKENRKETENHGTPTKASEKTSVRSTIWNKLGLNVGMLMLMVK